MLKTIEKSTGQKEIQGKTQRVAQEPEKKRINTAGNADTELYSFDVFDTLITRTTAYPAGIFTIMQRYLISEQKCRDIPYFIRHNFYTIRVETESYVRRNKFLTENTREITFDEIYEVIKNNYNLSGRQIEKLKELELETEIKNIRPIKQNIDMLKDMIKAGRRVVLISDMYHSAGTIRGFLMAADDIFENIPLYVSSEYNKTKASGDLYRHIAEIENIEPQKWVHFGDNKQVDTEQAKKSGLSAQCLPLCGFKRYEQMALQSLCEDFSAQSLIGLARLTRGESQIKSKTYEFGSSYTAPILYNYVSWVINQAQERGIKCLHFVARDGYVLKAIADVIIEKKNLPLKTKYLYGSRAAWRIPDDNNYDEYIHVMCSECRDRFSLNFIAARLDIDVNVLQKYSGIKDRKKVLTGEQIDELENKLITSDEFRQYLIDANYTKRELLEEYLQQNLDTTSDTIAFVDINGTGLTQEMLANIIKKFYDDPHVMGFYFHLSGRTFKGLTVKISYILTRRYAHCLIELLCRNLEGQTIGYKRTRNGVEPVLDKIDKTQFLNWGYDDYLQGIKDFTENACIFETANNLSLLSYSLYINYFNYFYRQMDKEMASIAGSIPFAFAGSEERISEGAPEYKFWDTIKYLISGKMKLNNFQGSSFISIKRSGTLLKKVHKFNRKYGSLRKFLLNIYFSRRMKHFYIRILGIKISFSWGKNNEIS